MRSSRLTVEQEGFLTLPADVCDAVGLQHGDILAIKVDTISFSLEIYRELLTAGWDCVGPSARWGFVARFLSRPLTAVEAGGRVWIPAEVFPLHRGEVELVVYLKGDCHVLQIFDDAFEASIVANVP